MPEQPVRFEPNPNVVMTKLDERSAVVLDLNTKQYYTLNETGIRIWELLHEGRMTDEIAAALQAEYEVESERALRSIAVFCEMLTRERLMHAKAKGGKARRGPWC